VRSAGQWAGGKQLPERGLELCRGVQRQVSATFVGVDGLWLVYRIEPMAWSVARLFTAARPWASAAAAALFRSGRRAREDASAGPGPSRFQATQAGSSWWKLLVDPGGDRLWLAWACGRG